MSLLDQEIASFRAWEHAQQWKMWRRRIGAILVIVAVVGFCVAMFFGIMSGCTPQPSPVPMPPVDASDASSCYTSANPACCTACQNLAAIGCSDGLSPNCAPGLANIDQSGKFPTPCGSALCPPITCAALSTARTIAEARTCGAGCL